MHRCTTVYMNLRTENLVANKTRFSKLPLKTLHTSGLKEKLIESLHQLTLKTFLVAVIEFNIFFLLSLKILTKSPKFQGQFSLFHLFQKSRGYMTLQFVIYVVTIFYMNYAYPLFWSIKELISTSRYCQFKVIQPDFSCRFQSHKS